MGEVLKAAHMSVSYNGREVVHDVSFTLQEGEVLGIVGESGSGKSTIVRAVMGLLDRAGMVTRGDVWYRGRPVLDLPERAWRKLRGPEMAMIFQDCAGALCPVRTVGAQMYEAMRAHRACSKEEVRRLSAEVLEKIGLPDPERIWNSYPFQLSGGQSQRVGVCMAVMQRPRLLLADEPTSALDVTVQRQVIGELLRMRRAYQAAMVLVTHNIGVVREMADTVLVLRQGYAVEYGEREQVLTHPAHPYTKELLRAELRLRRDGDTA